MRLLLVLAAVAALVVASWVGLVRMGWEMGRPPAVTLHGPLIVLGFLGTMIGMERAVALRRRWAWAAPAGAAASVVAMLTGVDPRLPAFLLAVGGVVLVAVFVTAHRIQPEPYVRVMGAGAVCWVVAALAWGAGSSIPALVPTSSIPALVPASSIPALVPAMAGFLVLTIAGERLELTRMVGPRPLVGRALSVAALILVAAAVVAVIDLAWGSRLAGIGLVGVAGILARFDVARRTVRMAGVTRYMATALLVGYAWLAVAGILWVGGGLHPGTLVYDAAVHALFLGFVISMVFAHAPVVVPSLTRLDLPYHPRLWVPLALLHGTLSLRIAGDLVGSAPARMWGGMGNVAAIALFGMAVAAGILGARPRGEDQRRRWTPRRRRAMRSAASTSRNT